MDKKKLLSIVREKTGWDRDMALKATDTVLDTIRDLVKEGNRLTVHGFGSFTMKLAKPRKARNLKTGESVLVPARRKVKFKASPEFLD